MVGNPAYRVLGEAPAPWLVIIHGLALDHREFLPFAETWSKDWRVLLWDMPGHGDSQPFPARFSLESAADGLDALLAKLGVERAVFVGFSFGGMVTQALARRRRRQSISSKRFPETLPVNSCAGTCANRTGKGARVGSTSLHPNLTHGDQRAGLQRISSEPRAGILVYRPGCRGRGSATSGRSASRKVTTRLRRSRSRSQTWTPPK